MILCEIMWHTLKM